MDSVEKYKQTLDKIGHIMSYKRDILKVFGSRGTNILKEALSVMQKQMDKHVRDEEVIVSNGDMDKVGRVVEFFLSIAVNEPIVPIFRDLSEVYLLLIFNWNKELGKSLSLENRVKAINNITKGQMTMLDTVDTLKVLLKRAKQVSKYEPPAFQLSKHYLKSLSEETDT